MLSKRDGQDLSCLDKAMQKSYRHNAELYYQELYPPVVEEVVEVKPETPANQCPECKGKKIIEYRHGLLQVTCPTCKGTGEILKTEGVLDGNDKPDHGTQPDDKPTGSKDTSKPNQSKKPPTKKKIRKGNS